MSTLTLTIEVTPESATLADVKQQTTMSMNAVTPVPLEELSSLGEAQSSDNTLDMAFEPLPLEELEGLTSAAQITLPDPMTPEELESLGDAPKPEDDF